MLEQIVGLLDQVSRQLRRRHGGHQQLDAAELQEDEEGGEHRGSVLLGSCGSTVSA